MHSEADDKIRVISSDGGDIIMNIVRALSATLGIGCLIVGLLMSGRFEQAFGHTLFIAGAIIIAGVLISSAIVENKRKE